MNPRELPKIDCTGFNFVPVEAFKCTSFKSRSEEEKDRFMTLLKPTGWIKILEEKVRNNCYEYDLGRNYETFTIPYAELIPVGGVAGNDEILGMIVLGSVSVSVHKPKAKGLRVQGNANVVRFRIEHLEEIEQALREDRNRRNSSLLQTVSNDNAFRGKTHDTGSGIL